MPAYSGLRRPHPRAKALGFAAHFLAGQIFALIYLAVFSAINRSGFALGALFGLLHGMFAGTALVNVLLPVVHPRMGTTESAADSHPLLEPPGFQMLNYGRRTPARERHRTHRIRRVRLTRRMKHRRRQPRREHGKATRVPMSRPRALEAACPGSGPLTPPHTTRTSTREGAPRPYRTF